MTLTLAPSLCPLHWLSRSVSFTGFLAVTLSLASCSDSYTGSFAVTHYLAPSLVSCSDPFTGSSADILYECPRVYTFHLQVSSQCSTLHSVPGNRWMSFVSCCEDQIVVSLCQAHRHIYIRHNSVRVPLRKSRLCHEMYIRIRRRDATVLCLPLGFLGTSVLVVSLSLEAR